MVKYLLIFGAIVQLAGIYGYAKDVVKGNAKPNKMGWLLWSIPATIAMIAAISAGVKWAVIPVF
ncbi:MAG: hypothetical protein ABIC91_07210 [Nanoarchaeota archaeon]